MGMPENWSAAPKVEKKKKVNQKKTREELEEIVKMEIQKSDISKYIKDKVLENFLKSFPRDEKLDELFERLVTFYPFLIEEIPTKPSSCVNRMNWWEKYLFKTLPPKEAL